MSAVRTFLLDQTGASATEFALLLPLLIILLFGGSESAHFVWTQHKLAEAVRDGARYASRLQIDKVCDGPTDVLTNGDHPEEHAQVILITRTGQLANPSALAVVPRWTSGQVSVAVNCESFVVDPEVDGGQGIYTDLGTRGPVVTVSAANVPYPSLFNGLGGGLSGLVNLNAKSSAAVIGL